MDDKWSAQAGNVVVSFSSSSLFAKAVEIQKTKTFIWLSGWKSLRVKSRRPTTLELGPKFTFSPFSWSFPNYNMTTQHISISQDHLAIFVLWGRGHDFQGRIKCTVEIIQTADEHRSQTQIFHAQRDASCGRCFSRTGSTGRAGLAHIWSLCALDTRLRLKDRLGNLVWLFQA